MNKFNMSLGRTAANFSSRSRRRIFGLQNFSISCLLVLVHYSFVSATPISNEAFIATDLLEDRSHDLSNDDNRVTVVLETKRPATDMQCAALTSCGECTALNGCGWCPSSASCIAGDEIGPSNPSTACHAAHQHGQWTFGLNSCKLLDIQDCVSCIWFRSGMHGWCRSTGKCYVGNDTGPTGGLHCEDWQTTGSNYFCRLPSSSSALSGGEKLYDTCEKCVEHDRKLWALAASDTGCYNYSSILVKRFQFGITSADCEIFSAPTCAQCTSAAAGGGWCHDTQKCYQRNNYGPNTFYTCPSNSAFTTTPSGCHVGAAKCISCHAGNDGLQRFGWCPSRSACLSVDVGDARHEPANGTCNATKMDGQWLNDVSQCDILSASSCSDCVKHAFAGWCPSLNKCFLKDDNLQPLGLSCPASQGEGVWSLDQNDCRVLRASTCEECLTTGTKFGGWCDANSKCYRGTDHGPEGGLTCPERQWKWRVGQCNIN